MSRTAQSPTRRPFAASLLALAGLASPLATSHAQGPSPERALLNSVPGAFRVVVVGNEPPSPTIDGNRALLGRSASVTDTPIFATRSHGDVLVVDGEQALLGHVGPAARRRLTLVW